LKILVGTLYSGENEYEDCLASIRKQTFTDYDHLIIADKPELEAHHQLYQTFLDSKDKYELLIKVDADMVLISDHFFEEVVAWFSEDPMLALLSVGVLDFLSGQMINGLQVYSNTVTWNFELDTLYPDVAQISLGCQIYDTKRLAPAAMHSPNPSLLQAFHYGAHRGLKSIQRKHSTIHWALLEHVWQNFLRTDDRRMGIAILGAELVYAGKFGRAEHNYTNPSLDKYLEAYMHLDAFGIKREVRKLRFRHWGLLPNDMRRRVIREVRGHRAGVWDI
jgi:hypothetical protein